MKLKRSHLAAAIVLLSAAPAFAQETGPYVAGSIGMATIDADAQSLSDGLAARGFTNRVEADETAVAFKLLGGYRLHRNFGVEAGYVNFGKFDFDVDTYSPVAIRGTGDTKAYGFDLAAIGYLPVSETLTLFAKAGANRWSVKQRFSASSGGFTASVDESANGWSPMIGAGVLARLTANLVLRFDFDYYNKVGDKDKTGESDVGLFTTSLMYRF